jgi:hypothetical protein
MKEQKIDLGNHSTLHVDRHANTVWLGIAAGKPGVKPRELSGAYYGTSSLGTLIEELKKLEEKMRKPPFEPVTITLNTPDEVKALTGILGKLTRKATASALGVHDMDHRAYAVDVAFNALYRFLSDKADGYPD